MSATAKKPLVNYLDHLPQGSFALDVMPAREGRNCQDWAALLVDVDPRSVGSHYPLCAKRRDLFAS
jgi:hypothetical protein